MKESNNTLMHHSPIHKEQMYQYCNSYNNIICRLVSLPILLRLIELSMSKPKLIQLLANNGLKYTYGGLCSALSGHNFRSVNMDYFAKIYYVLGIPMPSVESLLNTYLETGGKVLLKKRTVKIKTVNP